MRNARGEETTCQGTRVCVSARGEAAWTLLPTPRPVERERESPGEHQLQCREKAVLRRPHSVFWLFVPNRSCLKFLAQHWQDPPLTEGHQVFTKPRPLHSKEWMGQAHSRRVGGPASTPCPEQSKAKAFPPTRLGRGGPRPGSVRRPFPSGRKEGRERARQEQRERGRETAGFELRVTALPTRVDVCVTSPHRPAHCVTSRGGLRVRAWPQSAAEEKEKGPGQQTGTTG